MHLTRPHPLVAIMLAAILVCLFAIPASAQAPDDDFLVTASQVGPAIVGSTAQEMAAQLGPNFEFGDKVRITVDFSGFVITSDGETQFRAAMSDGDQLNLLIVSNAAYKTAEGVGPGTLISDAEDIYGDATLTWNPDDESREFVSFANGPEGRLQFRTPGIGGNNTGIYADGEFSTTDYEPEATIASIWVSCVPGTDCPADLAPVEPTPTPTPEPDPTPTPEPDPKPTPQPDPEPTPGPDGGDSSDGSDDQLADTGAEENLLIAIVAALMVLGGSFLAVERHLGLGPAWLGRR